MTPSPPAFLRWPSPLFPLLLLSTLAACGGGTSGSGGTAGGGSGGATVTDSGGSGGAGGTTGGTGGTGGVAPALCEIADVGTGALHTCAIKANGTLWCWGRDPGSVGDGTLGGPACDGYCQPSPVEITALGSDVVQVTGGFTHTCAVKADGTLWCWGENSAGALGHGVIDGLDCGTGTVCDPSPKQVTALGSDVRQVSTGFGVTCAVKTDGTLWCWGDNRLGLIGDGTDVGPDCDGTCNPTPTQVASLGADVTSVSVAESHACALRSDGTLWCWGNNGWGELGDGTFLGLDCDGRCNATPAQVTALGADVASVSANGLHTCVLRKDSSVWCWGDNTVGELGDGTASGEPCDSSSFCRPTPVQVAGLADGAERVISGWSESCALAKDGALWCWGLNQAGQIGDGTFSGAACNESLCRPAPVQVKALGTSVKSLSAGVQHACAVTLDGALWCWGDNMYSQLGVDGSSPSPSPLPVVVGDCP